MIGRHGAMLWIVVKIQGVGVEQPFCWSVMNKHPRVSESHFCFLLRLSSRNLYGRPAGQQPSFALVLLQV
jgi:hypothetical protein